MPSKPNGVWIDASFVLIADAGNSRSRIACLHKIASTTRLAAQGCQFRICPVLGLKVYPHSFFSHLKRLK